MSIGPKITIRRSCADCAVCQGERYTCQSDSGTDVYCAHPSFPQRRIIGDSRWDTPQWCPAEPEIAARADARITELERECSQWRDELRIYRETDDARIAELELDAARYRWLRRRVRLAREEMMSGAIKECLTVRMAWSSLERKDDPADGYFSQDRFNYECDALDAAIDAARAGNGGGV